MSPARIVIAGGGPAAVEAMLALRDLAEDRVALTVVAPNRELELQPLRIAVAFGIDHPRGYALDRVAEAVRAGVVQAHLAAVDVERRAAVLADGRRLPYDALVVATGAVAEPWLGGAVTVGTPGDRAPLTALLRDVEHRHGARVAVVVPPGCSWPLPAYELALLAVGRIRASGAGRAAPAVLTPEEQPLALFGTAAGAAVARLLDDAGVAFLGGSSVVGFREPDLELSDGRTVRATHVVTLPHLRGRRTPGLPSGDGGFLPVDADGRVRGASHVFAAGDGTDGAIKQGGLGCRQADAVARAIAADLGAPTPWPVPEPVLRGKLLTPRGAGYLRARLDDAAGGTFSDRELWRPPAKLSSRYLSRMLAFLDGPDAELADALGGPEGVSLGAGGAAHRLRHA